MIEIQDLTVRFGSHTVYSNVGLSVRPGQLVCLVGPSGSGKSVLLGLLLGNLPSEAAVSGSVRLFGAEVSRAYPTHVLRRVGIVFQQDALFEDLSVRGNVSFALRNGGVARVDELLHQVGLDGVPERVEQLSGGQRKRVALARTLAAQPELLLFDEPTSGLDPARSRQIAALIAETHRLGAPSRTTLVVTHDCDAVLPIAERVVYVDAASAALREVSREEALALLLDPSRRPPPAPPRRRPGLADLLLAPLRSAGDVVLPLARFVLNPLPSSLRQLWLRLREACLGPAAFIAAASLLVGALATFFALENNPLRGALDRPVLIGLGKVLVAIVAPLCAGCLFAARVGAGETARLGHLRYSRQVDALRSFGRPRSTYLEAPLLWACIAAVPLLTAASAILASIASLAVTGVIRPVSAHAWAAAFFAEVGAPDVPWLLAQSLGSGLLVGLTSARHGLAPKSSAEDISDAVTSAIVSGSLGVILWQSALAFLRFGGRL
jgi:ABC-type transporter Mla maintaining outer membrane lipid asymmetry ATPase subunit MlaF/ABC-type transporter Mla maintaining outer membrane lipid asymmetry permease subunit MlaE